MTENEYNPCWDCAYYDEDIGCLMLALDLCYDCPLENENEEEANYES